MYRQATHMPHPAISSEYRRVLAAEGVSNFGTMLSRLAIPWLATLVLQATPAQMAMLLLADVVAAALAGLWLGRWVDAGGKRAAMVRADLARAAVLAVLGLAAMRGWASFTLLLVGAVVHGVLTMAFELARSAWMAQRLPAADLPGANAQLAVASHVSEAAAFALGGWLYQGLGAAWALGLDAMSYLASVLCLRGVAEVPGPAAQHSPATERGWRMRWRAIRREARQGLGLVAMHPTLHVLAAGECLLAFALALGGTSYMIFASRDLALPTGLLGMVFALGGAGGAAGACLAPMLGRHWGAGRSMAAGLALAGLGWALLPLANSQPWTAIALLVGHQLLGDAGQALYSVHDRSLRQTAVSAAWLARADAGIRSLGQLATLAGALLGGLLGTWLGARAVLTLAALALLVAMALMVWREPVLRGDNPASLEGVRT